MGLGAGCSPCSAGAQSGDSMWRLDLLDGAEQGCLCRDCLLALLQPEVFEKFCFSEELWFSTLYYA